ncbi:hypothetical protein [Gillisia sp. JM1]|uniref:hypothetical protein n=1 Tax=Gillisia sp. JM1 TaxID=1283286 RepID=UPI0004100CEF|nr:hypothetical protein [Gillisia sp. JM1]
MNREINTAHLESVKNSPFESSNTVNPELKVQLKFRDSYLQKLTELKTKYPNKPILLTESYSYICFGCVASYVNIFVDGVLVNYKFDSKNKKYIEKIEYKNLSDLENSNGSYDDIKELYEKLEIKKDWNKNPKLYGNEDCSDGDQTFYSVYYPNGKIESMYMRCWTPIEYREKNK